MRSASTCCSRRLRPTQRSASSSPATGPDRERLEQVAQSHELNGRVEFRGRVDAAELADLYARCGAVYYAPVDEDFGMVPYEAFLSGKPVVTTTDAGGPLDVVADRRTGLVTAPRADELAAALRYLRDHPAEGAGVGPRRQGGRRARDLGRCDRAAARMKVAYYSPLPPERSGIADYSALLLPALQRASRRRRARARADEAAARDRALGLPRRQQPRRPRLDRRRAAPDARRRRAARLRAPPPRRRAHARAQGRRGLPERDGARRGPARAACSRSASSTAASRRSGRRVRRTSRSRARCSISRASTA